MNIDDVRKFPCIGDWYKPYSKATYMKMKKEEIIEHLAVAFANWQYAEEALNRYYEYAKKLYDMLKTITKESEQSR